MNNDVVNILNDEIERLKQELETSNSVLSESCNCKNGICVCDLNSPKLINPEHEVDLIIEKLNLKK